MEIERGVFKNRMEWDGVWLFFIKIGLGPVAGALVFCYIFFLSFLDVTIGALVESR